MKDNQNAFFLLTAIGELSESTIAEAKLPVPKREQKNALRSFRRPISLVASIALLAAMALTVIVGPGLYSRKTHIIDKSAYTVTLSYAVHSAMHTLRESGVFAVLTQADLIDNVEKPYYQVKLSAKDGTYDCTVDAQNGQVMHIAHKLPDPTQAEDDDPDPAYDSDTDGGNTDSDNYDDDYYDDDGADGEGESVEDRANDFISGIEADAMRKAEEIADAYRQVGSGNHSVTDGVTGGVSGNSSPDPQGPIAWDIN